MSAVTAHVIVAVAGIVAYTILVALGHDGTVVLAGALCYAGGASVQRFTR